MASYGTEPSVSESFNLKISDMDAKRVTLQIRKSKGEKTGWFHGLRTTMLYAKVSRLKPERIQSPLDKMNW